MARLGSLKPGMVFFVRRLDRDAWFGSVLEIIGESAVKVLLNNKDVVQWALGTEVELKMPLLSLRLDELTQEPMLQSQSAASTAEVPAQNGKTKTATTLALPKAKAPKGELMGFPIGRVIQSLGQAGENYEGVTRILKERGIDSKESTILTCLRDVRNPKYARPAPLSAEQLAELRGIPSPAPEKKTAGKKAITGPSPAKGKKGKKEGAK